MLNDLKYFETPILFYAIFHAHTKKILNFAASMLFFSQQSYLKPRWATLSLKKTFFSYKMPHKLGPWLQQLESTHTCWTAMNNIKPMAAYVMFSIFNFSDNIPPVCVKLALQ